MRIRSIKPEFWRSSDIAKLDVEDRLLFIALWSYVDDNGVGIDKLASIAADLFADDIERDPSETFARVSRGLQNLSEAGRIVRYTVDGRDYLEITNWGKHQRIDKPNKARFPSHTDNQASIRATLARVAEKVAPGTGEQRNRGTEEQGIKTCSPAPPPSDRPTRFDEFWETYPRKVGKDKAKTKYTAATKRADEQTIIDGAHRLANDPNLPEPKYIPHPTTWLERGGWNDEPLPARWDAPKSDQRLQQGFDLVQRVAARGEGAFDYDPFEGKAIER